MAPDTVPEGTPATIPVAREETTTTIIIIIIIIIIITVTVPAAIPATTTAPTTATVPAAIPETTTAPTTVTVPVVIPETTTALTTVTVPVVSPETTTDHTGRHRPHRVLPDHTVRRYISVAATIPIMCPFFGNYHRPLPPPAWRPAVYGPSFGTILGIALGTTVDMTLRTLLNQGYNVTSYGNNVVYLTNVPQMNYYWPDAALYYNNGALCGSSFTYPSTYYDMSRYNALYNTFCSQYGVPVRSVNQGGIISSTWFGDGNRYVTLEFNSNYGDYYTTLSFGL